MPGHCESETCAARAWSTDGGGRVGALRGSITAGSVSLTVRRVMSYCTSRRARKCRPSHKIGAPCAYMPRGDTLGP